MNTISHVLLRSIAETLIRAGLLTSHEYMLRCRRQGGVTNITEDLSERDAKALAWKLMAEFNIRDDYRDACQDEASSGEREMPNKVKRFWIPGDVVRMDPPRGAGILIKHYETYAEAEARAVELVNSGRKKRAWVAEMVAVVELETAPARVTKLRPAARTAKKRTKRNG